MGIAMNVFSTLNVMSYKVVGTHGSYLVNNKKRENNLVWIKLFSGRKHCLCLWKCILY